METTQFTSYCGDTYERWEECGRYRCRRIAKAHDPAWQPIPRPPTSEEQIKRLTSALTSAEIRLEQEKKRYEDRVPTQWAYDQVCEARTKWQTRAETAEAALTSAKEEIQACEMAKLSIMGTSDRWKSRAATAEVALAAAKEEIERLAHLKEGYRHDCSMYREEAERLKQEKAETRVECDNLRFDLTAERKETERLRGELATANHLLEVLGDGIMRPTVVTHPSQQEEQ